MTAVRMVTIVMCDCCAYGDYRDVWLLCVGDYSDVWLVV